MSEHDVSLHAESHFRHSRFSVRFDRSAIEVQQTQSQTVKSRVWSPSAAVDGEFWRRIRFGIGTFEALEDVGEHVDGVFGEWVAATLAVDAQQESARVRRYDAEGRFSGLVEAFGNREKSFLKLRLH